MYYGTLFLENNQINYFGLRIPEVVEEVIIIFTESGKTFKINNPKSKQHY